MRAIVLGAVLALQGLSPATAQMSFGVGIEFGGPAYYGPPPFYVYEQPPPIIYGPPEAPSAVPPDVVFDMLDRAGYRELGPMAFRDGVYKLDAVNRNGELVALEISVLTGEVEIERILGRQVAVPLPPPPAPVEAPPPPQPEPGRDPLVVY